MRNPPPPAIPFSVCLILFSFLIFLTGCKAGNSLIVPIIPQGEKKYHGDNGWYPDAYRHGYRSGSKVRMIGTGPEELFKSRLNPPQITNKMPTFSVRVENNITPPSSEDFKARLDFNDVHHSLSGNEVSFTPDKPMEGGEHRAELHFKNPDGYPLTFTWEFVVAVEPPEISAVFLNAHGTAIVFLDHPVEPEYLTDHSRWKLNGYSGVLDSKIEIFNMSNLIVQFTFLKSAFNELKIEESVELSLTDDVGTGNYTIDVPKGIIGLDQGRQSCPPNYCTAQKCSATAFCFCGSGGICGYGEMCRHEPFENEDYAIVWRVNNPNQCRLELQLTDFQAIPVKNSNPESVPYDQTQDTEVEGNPRSLCDPTDPIKNGPYSLNIPVNKTTGTLKFPANWKHYQMNWVVYCYYCWIDGAGNAHYERTLIASGILPAFTSAFDSTVPDFPNLNELGITTSSYPNPVVLYGSELADYLENIFSMVPLYGDPNYNTPSNQSNVHCYGKYRADLDWELYCLREWFPCDLFVFAAAEDIAHVNPYHPQDVNHKRIFPVLGLQVFTIDQYGSHDITWNGQAHFDHLMAGTLGWECDFKPWGSPVIWNEPLVNYPDDYEIYTTWEDITYKEVPDCTGNPNCPPGHPGWLMQDYNRSELVLQWWNLSEELQGKEDYQLVDIRVRIEDEVVDPVTPGGFYNWRRSEDIMDQLCWPDISECNYNIKTEFINDNQYDYDDGINTPPENKLKRVHYSGDTDNNDTSFIYIRDDQGNTFLDYYIAINEIKYVEPSTLPDEIPVVFFSSESDIPENMKDPNNTNPGHEAEIHTVATRYSLLPQFPDNIEARIKSLMFDSGLPNEALLYYVKIKVSDSERSRTDRYPPVLFVSSSDDKWGDTPDGWMKKMDFAKTADSDHWKQGFTAPQFMFGQNRGRGGGKNRDDEDINWESKVWYSYDEFISNGGIEVVSATVEDTKYASDTDRVAVQSEADILVVTAHGAENGEFGGKENYGWFVYPNYNPLPWGRFNDLWDPNHQTHYPTGLFSDYGPAEPGKPNAWGLDKCGNFWLKKNRTNAEPELRWLTLLTCDSLKRKDATGALNWKTRVGNIHDSNPNYLSSICGYKGLVSKLLFGQIDDKYGNKMRTLFENQINNDNPYEPTGPVFLDEKLWDKDEQGNPKAPTDISVSAFMEASAQITSNRWFTYVYHNDRAVAIDKDNSDDNENKYFYYELHFVGAYLIKGYTYTHRIKRSEL